MCALNTRLDYSSREPGGGRGGGVHGLYLSTPTDYSRATMIIIVQEGKAMEHWHVNQAFPIRTPYFLDLDSHF